MEFRQVSTNTENSENTTETEDSSDNVNSAILIQEIKDKLVYAASYTTYVAIKYYLYYCSNSYEFAIDSLLADTISQVEEDIEAFINFNNGNETGATYIHVFNNAKKLYIEAQDLLVDYILKYIDQSADVSKLEYIASIDTASSAIDDVLSVASTTKTTANKTNRNDIYDIASYTYSVAYYINYTYNRNHCTYYTINTAINNFVLAYYYSQEDM